jgi:hypothetical protein
LEPGSGIVHGGGRLKIFRAKHGDDEIGEAGEGDQADDDDFHDGKKGEEGGASGESAHFFAENGVSGAEDEKGHGDGDKDEIVHGW